MKTIKNVLFVTVVAGSLWACAGGTSSSEKESARNVESQVIDMSKQEVIKLEAPNLEQSKKLMTVLSERQSRREFADKKLTVADLSDLLWAANGINRPGEGKRTAPSAINAQDVDIYVCAPEGAFIYDANAHALNPVTNENLIPMVADAQDFVKTAPVCIVLVSNLTKFGDRINDEARLQNLSAIDVGIVSQNISLFCTSAGLATVPRAYMNVDALKSGLKLSERQIPILNHPIGYIK